MIKSSLMKAIFKSAKAVSYFAFIIFIFISFSAASQIIVYVTPSGAGSKNGTSWANAYEGTQLQTQVASAS